MYNDLNPYLLKVIKYISKHPDISTEALSKKFGDTAFDLLLDLEAKSYLRHPLSESGRSFKTNIWIVSDKGTNALKSKKYIFSLSLADRIITAISSFAVGIAVGYVVSLIK